MVKKILILTNSKFDKRDYLRFGVPDYLKAGIQVHVLDFSPLLRSSHYNEKVNPLDEIKEVFVLKINSYDNFSRFIKKMNASETFALFFFSLDSTSCRVFQILSNSDISYGCIYLGVLPATAGKFRMKISQCKFKLELQTRWRKIKAANLVIIAGLKAINSIPYKTSRKTIFLQSGAIDYCTFRRLNDSKKELLEYPDLIFIDEFYPVHPDLEGSYLIDPEFYYHAVNCFLTKISITYQLSCGIAVHPRAVYTQNPYKFPLYIKQSAETIAAARFVAGHESTAFSFAVLFRKPIFLLEFKSTFNSIYGICLRNYAKELNIKPIDLESNYNIPPLPVVDVKKYEKFEQNYLFAGIDKSEYYYPEQIVKYCQQTFN